MLLKISLLFLWIWHSCSGQNFKNCDFNLTLGRDKFVYLRNMNYPKKYPTGRSCRFIYKTDPYYTIKAECSVRLDSSASQKFYVSRDGDALLRYGEYFFNHDFVRESYGQQMSFAITSVQDGRSGLFSCKLTSVFIKSCDCGWSQTIKIYNGMDATPNEFSSMVGVVSRATERVFCGAAIIHYYYILSAAHCFPPSMKESQIYARVGDHDQTVNGDTMFEAAYDISRIIRHESYNPQKNENDIALLKTVTDILFNRGVGPICLPLKYALRPDYFANYLVTIAGWGTLEFGGKAAKILQKTYLKIMRTSECTDSKKDPRKICTKTPEGYQETDSCQMDSGGNLYFWDNYRYYSIGIISYGSACGAPTPSMNTRITSYLSWIKLKTGFVSFCDK